jgi:hypothetical protein
MAKKIYEILKKRRWPNQGAVQTLAWKGKKPECSACHLLQTALLFGLFFSSEERNMFLRDVGLLWADYTALYPRR